MFKFLSLREQLQEERNQKNLLLGKYQDLENAILELGTIVAESTDVEEVIIDG